VFEIDETTTEKRNRDMPKKPAKKNQPKTALRKALDEGSSEEQQNMSNRERLDDIAKSPSGARPRKR
jgi:hypothetical protein